MMLFFINNLFTKGWVFGLTSENAENASRVRSESVSSMSSFASSEASNTRDKLNKLRYLYTLPKRLWTILYHILFFCFRIFIILHQLTFISRFELDNLQTKVNVERERYQAAATSQLSIVSAIPKLHINDRLTLSAADASYLLRYSYNWYYSTCVRYHAEICFITLYWEKWIKRYNITDYCIFEIEFKLGVSGNYWQRFTNLGRSYWPTRRGEKLSCCFIFNLWPWGKWYLISKAIIFMNVSKIENMV